MTQPSKHPRRTARPSRRAFTLVLGLIAMLVVSVIAAMLMSRSSAQARLMNRQIRYYELHHAGRGVQEAVHAWLDTQGLASIDEALDEDGRAVDLYMPDGTVLSVYMQDGQGTLMIEPLGLTDVEQYNTARALEILNEQHDSLTVQSWVRSLGPASLSVNAAPDEVITALCEAALDSSRGARLAGNILSRRARSGSEPLGRAELTQAYTDLALSGDDRTAIDQMLTVQPTLWQVEILVRPGRGGPVLARFGGLVDLAPDASTLDQPGNFLSFNELPSTRTDALR